MSMLLKGELEKIVELIRSTEARVVLEIGCYKGATSLAIMKAVPSIKKYIGIDVNRTIRDGKVLTNPGQIAIADPRFEIRLSKRGSFDLMPEDIGPVDVAFIDGDHGEKAVRHDTELSRSIVRPGGIIIWHDYANPGAEVQTALKGDARVNHIEGTWLAFERIK